MAAKRSKHRKTRAPLWIYVACIVLLGVFGFAMLKLYETRSSQVAGVNTIASSAALPRLGVREAATGGEFFNTVTGNKVYLRGNNYIRFYKNPVAYNFDVGKYDRAVHIRALDEMKQYGYNAVRVIVTIQGLTKTSEAGVNKQMAANFSDFVKLSQARGIYVLPVLGFTLGAYYNNVKTESAFEGDWKSFNKLILQKGFVDAKARLMRDIVLELKNQGTPLSAIVGWQIENEIYFEDKIKPFSLKTGSVTTANGKSYNMAIASDKLKMVDENTAYFVDTVKSAIRQIDPKALVSVSYASPAHNRIGYRGIIRPGYLARNSTVDFLDIHIYPGWFELTDEMNTFDVKGTKKPLILGEYGAYPSKYKSIEDGAHVLKKLQVDTCKQYFFSGWFAYDYDTVEMEPGFRIYHVTEGNGAINIALSPKYRPDPCSMNSVSVSETSVAINNQNTFSAMLTCGAPTYAKTCIPTDKKFLVQLAAVEEHTKVLFATWNHENGLDDQKNYYAIRSGRLWGFEIDPYNHMGSGRIQSNVWTFDRSGKQNWCTALVAQTCR